MIDDPSYPCSVCGVTIDFPRSKCVLCEAEEARAKRLTESRAWTESLPAKEVASEKSESEASATKAVAGERVTEIAKHYANQLRGEEDVLAFYISVVGKDHHSSVYMAGEYDHSQAEDPKADVHRALSELYEAMMQILFHEMKTEEGKARVHEAFSIILEKKAEAEAGAEPDKVVVEESAKTWSEGA